MKRYRWLVVLLLVVFILASGALLRSLAQTKDVVSVKPIEITGKYYDSYMQDQQGINALKKEIQILELHQQNTLLMGAIESGVKKGEIEGRTVRFEDGKIILLPPAPIAKKE